MAAAENMRTESRVDQVNRVDVTQYIRALGQRARLASRELPALLAETRALALRRIAARLDAMRDAIIAANSQDLARAREREIAKPLLDRLVLDDAGVGRMIEGLRQVGDLPDPIGRISDVSRRPSGIRVGRMQVPLGVVAIIYESRPNVTVDAASLCFKSGNACILRGGSEARMSNRAIARSITLGLEDADVNPDAVLLVETTDREAVSALARLDEFVDVLIPRGGKSLIERISRDATVPVIKHLDGICHVYIAPDADPTMALEIAVNSKTEKLAVCNAIETLLIDAAASSMLPSIAEGLHARGIELVGCERSRALVSNMGEATEADWREEYLGAKLAVRVVDGMSAAIEHIHAYGSAHTDAIVTKDYAKANEFLARVDSATVMVNASTQFADGFEFGLGAEIGISTDKLHARGPVGLDGLTSSKFIVLGDGQIRHR
ncbi:MAG: glutamate-5-semialdehyde dehydrogenase [Gammaproteobacteria bacterium]|nr:glutamate-5-semialdehyde dehydrogenase [Gammaproteobacteria bacterium]